MQYLTLELIKHNSRIDGDCENELLEHFGEAAEEAVLMTLNRTLADLKEANGGTVPKSVVTATLLLVDDRYKHRGNIEPYNFNVLPQLDFFLRPYMRIAD